MVGICSRPNSLVNAVRSAASNVLLVTPTMARLSPCCFVSAATAGVWLRQKPQNGDQNHTRTSRPASTETSSSSPSIWVAASRSTFERSSTGSVRVS